MKTRKLKNEQKRLRQQLKYGILMHYERANMKQRLFTITVKLKGN